MKKEKYEESLDQVLWEADLIGKDIHRARKAGNGSWFNTELKAMDIEPDRIDLAENLIDSTQRDLKRLLSDHEAKIVLVNSGQFPEIEEDLHKRALHAGSSRVLLGLLTQKPEKIIEGEEWMRAVVLGKRERTGD